MIELQLSQHANVPDALCISRILDLRKSARKSQPENVDQKSEQENARQRTSWNSYLFHLETFSLSAARLVDLIN